MNALHWQDIPCKELGSNELEAGLHNTGESFT